MKGNKDMIAISEEGIGIIVEIMHTETNKECDIKISKYPKDFEVLKVKVGEEPEIPF
jgi:hypothetical protein